MLDNPSSSPMVNISQSDTTKQNELSKETMYVHSYEEIRSYLPSLVKLKLCHS